MLCIFDFLPPHYAGHIRFRCSTLAEVHRLALKNFGMAFRKHGLYTMIALADGRKNLLFDAFKFFLNTTLAEPRLT
jgi:hypothetical protein